MNNHIETLRRAESSGRICGITTTEGKKYNGQVFAVGDSSVALRDRNLKKNILLRLSEVHSARCG